CLRRKYCGPPAFGVGGGLGSVSGGGGRGRRASGLSYNLENRKIISRISAKGTGDLLTLFRGPWGWRAADVGRVKACGSLQPRVGWKGYGGGRYGNRGGKVTLTSTLTGRKEGYVRAPCGRCRAKMIIGPRKK